MKQEEIKKWIEENLIMQDEARSITGQSAGAFTQSVATGQIKAFADFGNARKTRLYLRSEIEEYAKNKKGAKNMAKVYYEDVLVGEVMTNQSLTVDEALELIGFNEETFLSEQGWDELDYNDFRIEY